GLVELVRAELAGRALPGPPDDRWWDEIHPLLGAAPPGSFARTREADSWADFRGRRFARSRPAATERVLIVGGAAAVHLLPALEARLPRAEVVLAARESYGAAQEAILVGRFARALDATMVVAVDGRELAGPERPDGWTPEWEWLLASLEAPVGELLARHSGFA